MLSAFLLGGTRAVWIDCRRPLICQAACEREERRRRCGFRFEKREGKGEGRTNSSSLGVTRERLLSDDGDSVSLGSSEVLEDVVVDTRLVLVVGLGRSSWEGEKRGGKDQRRSRRDDEREFGTNRAWRRR